MAMLLYPECQKRGQEEVDRVVGRDRLPTFEDKEALPYISCIVQEILRCVRGLLWFVGSTAKEGMQDGILQFRQVRSLV